MIEFVVASLIVLCAALYWYARLFPQGWQKVRAGMGLKTSPAVINKSADLLDELLSETCYP